MTSLFRPQNSFLQNTAWQNSALNALHYQTSQQGSVVPLIYGTMRVQMNLIDMNGYRGPQGKKGKTGSLPISGTSRFGKGGGSIKGKGGKKDGHYTINLDVAICQGPVTFNYGNAVFSSSGVESFNNTKLNFYAGQDGQAPDPHFNQVGYSGTCHITGTPIDLGQSPVVPNIAFEITGILNNVHTGGYSKDANPADIVTDFLTNLRYGAAFPAECLSQLAIDDSGTITNTYGDYCLAAGLLVSTILDGHQKAIEWLNGLVILTNSALVWSGKLLKVIPYGDLTLDNNGGHWDPNWTALYNLTDHDFLPGSPHQDGAVPSPGDDDPIIVTRTNPADADNWVSIEYIDRNNFYNSTILTAFDQGAIDTYGLRIGDSLPGRVFTNPISAQIALQLILQRRLYIRNTGIKFNLGWQFALLEPMDLVSISGRLGDNYLNKYIVRITSIEENDNGDLAIVAEDPQPGASAPIGKPPPIAVYWPYPGPVLQWTWDLPADPVYDWRVSGPPDSPNGTFSVWINIDYANRPRSIGEILPDGLTATSNDVFGLIRTALTPHGFNGTPQLCVAIASDLSIFVYLGGAVYFQSPPGIVSINGTWQHILVTWSGGSFNPVKVWVNGAKIDNPAYEDLVGPVTIRYSIEGTVWAYSAANLSPVLTTNFSGCSNHFWFDATTCVNDPGAFRTATGQPMDLGPRGSGPLGGGRAPVIYLMTDGTGNITYLVGGSAMPGDRHFNLNWAGFKHDDGAYWQGVYPGSSEPQSSCDPQHQTMGALYIHPVFCNSVYW